MSEEPTMTKKRKSRRKTNGHSNGHTASLVEDPVVEPEVSARPEQEEQAPVEAPAPPEQPTETRPVEEPAVARSDDAPSWLVVSPGAGWGVPDAPATASAAQAEPASSVVSDPSPAPSPEEVPWFVRGLTSAPKAIGWTEALTKRLKQSKDFYELCLQVDREVLHLCAGIVALHLGDFEVVSINFQSCGIAFPQDRRG